MSSYNYARNEKLTSKKNIQEIITEMIIERLEKGTVPWQKPWSAGGEARNLISKKRYRGINAFVLNTIYPYENPFFATFNQIKETGGFIRKGEKGIPVIFWKLFKVYDGEENEAKEKTIPFMRHYTVFHISQAEGIPDYWIPALPEYKHDPIEKCEEVVKGFKCPKIEYGYAKACYIPGLDLIRLPKRERFHSAEEFYSVLFHEIIHSTGHKTRLSRKFGEHFGTEKYSQEELVAEMGATMLCSHCGIVNTTVDNSASYINSWLRKLEGDKKLIIIAAGQAQKAIDMILGIEESEE